MGMEWAQAEGTLDRASPLSQYPLLTPLLHRAPPATRKDCLEAFPCVYVCPHMHTDLGIPRKVEACHPLSQRGITCTQSSRRK